MYKISIYSFFNYEKMRLHGFKIRECFLCKWHLHYLPFFRFPNVVLMNLLIMFNNLTYLYENNSLCLTVSKFISSNFFIILEVTLCSASYFLHSKKKYISFSVSPLAQYVHRWLMYYIGFLFAYCCFIWEKW